VSSASRRVLEERLRRWLQDPPATAHRANGVRAEHSTHADQERVAASFAQVLDPDPARQLTSTDDFAGILCQCKENSPLLCAQVSEGVDDTWTGGHRSGAEH
jgi:hypothetical protein